MDRTRIARLSAGLLFLLAWKLFPDPTRKVPDLTDVEPYLRPFQPSSPMGHLYIVFAVPVVLAIFFAQASIFVGLSGRLNEDDDREWWGRAAGWVLAAGLGWMIGTAITVYGPVAIYEGPRLYALLTGADGTRYAVQAVWSNQGRTLAAFAAMPAP